LLIIPRFHVPNNALSFGSFGLDNNIAIVTHLEGLKSKGVSEYLWHAGARLSLSGDVFGRSREVHPEGPGFADNGADSTAPALLWVDDGL
jgi:hypothetical protein